MIGDKIIKIRGDNIALVDEDYVGTPRLYLTTSILKNTHKKITSSTVTIILVVVRARIFFAAGYRGSYLTAGFSIRNFGLQAT